MKTLIKTLPAAQSISSQLLADLQSTDKEEALSFLIRQNVKQVEKLFVIKIIFYCTIATGEDQNKYSLAITISAAITATQEHQTAWEQGPHIPVAGLAKLLAGVLTHEVKDFSPGLHQVRVDLGVWMTKGRKNIRLSVLDARPQGYSVSASTVQATFLRQWEKVGDLSIFNTLITYIRERGMLPRGAKKCSVQAEAVLNMILEMGGVNFAESGKPETHLDVNSYSAVIRFINGCLKELGYSDHMVCTEGRSYKYAEYALYKQKQ